MTATSYVEQILRQHLDLYKEEINRIYKEQVPKRSFIAMNTFHFFNRLGNISAHPCKYSSSYPVFHPLLR